MFVKDDKGASGKVLMAQQSTAPIATPNSWESICIERNKMLNANPPFSERESDIREIIYSADGVLR